MIKNILLYALIPFFYLIAIVMIFRVFLVALTFNSSVPFVPSSRRVIKTVLELLKLKKGDKVVDIGSGDGRFLLIAARMYPDIQFYGVEQNKFLVRLSRAKAKFLRLENLTIYNSLAEEHDFKSYNKVYMYMPDFFAGSILESIEDVLPNGAIVINAAFGFGEEFESTHQIERIPFTIFGKRSKISLWNK